MLRFLLWGIAVSRGMDTEMPEKATVWGCGEISGNHIPRVGAGTGEPDSGRVFVPGPRAYADRDAAEIFGSPGGGVYQREKRDSDSQKICWETKNFTGQSFRASGYYVSTVGRDEATIRKYIQEQEAEDKGRDLLELQNKPL
jgi:hypothetical protein